MENISNLNLESGPQGAALSGSVQPEEVRMDLDRASQDRSRDHSAARPRLSGAAKRRLAKQRKAAQGAPSSVPTSSGQRSGVVAQGALPQVPAAPKQGLEGGGRGGSVGTPKRTRPVHTTPSPSDVRQDKRPRVTAQGSFAQAAKGLVRVALILEGYPDKKLGAGEVALIRRMIRARILDRVGATRAPTFTGSWERDGAMVVSCADSFSEEWVKNLSSEIKIGESSLRAVSEAELPKRHRVVVHVEEPDIKVEESLRLLDLQNSGLAAGEWVVGLGGVKQEANGIHFTCLVGGSSLEAIRKCGSRPFCGLGRAHITWSDRDREKTPGSKEVLGGAGTV